MISDSQTNIVYFSSLLPLQHPKFWEDLKAILDRYSVKYRWITYTRDIWCRDYMPIQVSENNFVQFRFFPDYYLDHEHIRYLTIQDEMDYSPAGNIHYSKLIVDGGNIVSSSNKAFFTEKIFHANKNLERNTIKAKLKKELDLEDLFFLPVQPDDLSGHADGMIRFYDENTILVNEFKESPSWMRRFERTIRLSGLTALPFPYQASSRLNKKEYTAHGCYINFAQIGSLIILPQFGKEFANFDSQALKRTIELYPPPNYQVEPLNSDSVAWNGGVLNCCTWNISRPVILNAIEKIMPVYKLHDSILVVLEEDYNLKPVVDTVCIKISLNETRYLEPWSLAKHLKFGGFYNIDSEHEIAEMKNLISLKFDKEDISEIYSNLLNPPADVLSELVYIPERLKKYYSGNKS